MIQNVVMMAEMDRDVTVLMILTPPSSYQKMPREGKKILEN